MEKPEKPFILLVDDNEPTCTLITALLQKDFEIDVAIDGREAIEKLRTKTYAAIILDLLMPYIDGYGVLDYLRTNNPALLRHVLVVSAAISRNEIVRVQQYNVCAFISKPFEVETLLSAVKQCVATPGGSGGKIFSSGVIFLLADLLSHRLM